MASLTDIRAALKDTISAAVSDLHGYDTVPEVVNLPAFVVLPVSANFEGAMGRGLDVYEFSVIVLVSPSDYELGQLALDEYVTGAGPASIREAIFNANTLGLTNTNAHVQGTSRYGATWDVGDLPNIGAALSVQVATKGSE